MKRRLMTMGLITALVTSVALLPGVVGAEDVQTRTVSIVEPEGGTPPDWTFAPGELTVTIGQTVTWTNAGALPHTVTADDGVSFDSGNIDSQQTFSITAASPGTFLYHYLYHPWMTGSVIVTP